MLLRILGQLLFFLDFCIVHKPKMSVLQPSSLQGGIISSSFFITSIDRPPAFGNHSNLHICCLRYFKVEIQHGAKMSLRDSKISCETRIFSNFGVFALMFPPVRCLWISGGLIPRCLWIWAILMLCFQLSNAMMLVQLAFLTGFLTHDA